MSMSKAFPAKVIAAAFLLSQTFLLAPSMVLADSAVRIAGQQVFTLPGASVSRTKLVQEQLDNALVAAKDKTAKTVGVAYVNGLPVITVGGYQVVTVSASDAKTASTTPTLLAARWAAAIKGSLKDQSSIQNYVAQLSGETGAGSLSGTSTTSTATSASGLAAVATMSPPALMPDPAPTFMPTAAPSLASYSGGAPMPGATTQGPTVSVANGMGFDDANHSPVIDNSSAAATNYLADATPAPDASPLVGQQPTYDNSAPGSPSRSPAFATYDQNQPPPAASYGSYTPPAMNYGAPTQNYYNAPPNYAQGQYPGPGPGQGPGPGYGGGPGYRQGHVGYAPAGLVLPLRLKTPISTQVARSGDMVEAEISQTMQLGDATIPMGSAVVGTVSQAEAGRRLSRSGELGIKFTTIRTPDGVETPINAHLIGGIGKYAQKNDDGEQVVRGEGMTAKLGQTAIRGAAGAGIGAALGTAVGAIASHGYGVGTGAWSGAAIGGGIGVADMALRKGRDVTIPSGTKLQIQLDGPVTFAGAGGPGVVSGNF